jgi:type VI secretion system protein ImpJ
MRRLQPVLWNKGTLLTPQHLQAHDRFLEDSLQFWLESQQFSPWGLSELQIDRETLAAGLLSVSSASGVFPDGLLFDIPDADPAPPAKSLVEHFGPNDSSMDVYLAVPAYREKGINVSQPGGFVDARFVAEAAFARDELRSDIEKPVQLARKAFRILMESERRQDYSTLPMARIQRSVSGTFHLDETFVPPSLNILASDRLMSIARRILELLTAKSLELSALRKEKNYGQADFFSSESFWQLYAVNSHHPLFRHLYEVRRGHPEELFGVMLSLAGVLTTFSPDVHPSELPVYNHNDLTSCFTELDEKVRFLLDTTARKNHVVIPLNEVQPSIYHAAVAEDRFFEQTQLYLGLRADANRANLIAKGPSRIKIASANQIEDNVRRALNGLELLHVPSGTAATLPVKSNLEYFRLLQTGPVWESIMSLRNIGVWIPVELRPSEIELLIVLPKSA